MRKLRCLCVVGTRPNFIKIAPILRAINKKLQVKLLHTWQHYDNLMDNIFFKELSIKKPDFNLGVGSGSHSYQLAKITLGVERILKKYKPHIVIVVGDVNSTLASALVAKRMNIPIAHVESGLRSFDHSMPEETNRILTDHISQLLFTTEKSANQNLKNEGIKLNRIYFVGNVMIDSLFYHLNKKITPQKIIQRLFPKKKFELVKNNYALLTLHRPQNVDKKEQLKFILNEIKKISDKFKIKILFPIHPRTKRNIKRFNLQNILNNKRIICLSPIGYIDTINLIYNSKFILTFSGGMQEEAAALKKPCITLRQSTERPITIKYGSNFVVGSNSSKLNKAVKTIMSNTRIRYGRIPFWDGKTAERIVKTIMKHLKEA